MKKTFLFLLLTPFFLYSQSNYVALSSNDQENSTGTIITINDDIPQTRHVFTDNGAPTGDNLVEIKGKLYGLTTEYGPLNKGSLFEYDYTNETFEVLHFFESVGDTNTNYITNLCTDGIKIYGLQTQFFTGTSIVEYNIDTQTITPLVSLSTIGVSEVNDLLYASNNKIYGVSRPGSEDNILFSYDLSNGMLTNEFTFNTTDGNWCHSLMKHSNGNLYGATTYGGINDQGVIFEYNTTNNTYSVLYNLTTTEKADNLVEGNSNVLYGIVKPQSGADSRLYQFDLNTNTFSNLYYFSTGIQPIGNDAWFRDFTPLIFDNNKLLGVSLIQNNNQEQLFFQYDIDNNSMDLTLNGSDDGIITTSIFKTSDNRIVYGNRVYKGNGHLIEYDPQSQTKTELIGTKFGTDGENPNKIIKASSGLIYGVTADNFTTTYDDKFFSFNPETNDYNVLIDFASEPFFAYGNNPVNLIETTDGLIYIYTSFGGFAAEQGSLIEYNPNNGNHMLAHEFSDLYDGSTVGEHIELFEKNNIIYGVKRWGGNNILYKGTIFLYNTLTHTYTVLYESDDLTTNVATFLSSQNILYGVTSSGGANNEGYLYSYNIQTNQFNIIEDLSLSGMTDIVETDNGDIYGVFQNSHGTDGSIFKVDGSSGQFSTYYQFDNTNLETGYKPYKIYTVNNKLYVLTEATPIASLGVRRFIMEFDIQSASITKIFDEERNIDVPLRPDLYIMNDNRMLGIIPAIVSSNGSIIEHEKLFEFEQGNSSIELVLDFNNDVLTASNIIDLTDSSLSLENVMDNTRVLIHPNPTKDYLNIQSNSDIESVEVYSLLGQKVGSFYNQSKIDVSCFSRGIYLLKIKNDNREIQSVRFIKD